MITKTITVTAYTKPEGLPTCAVDFSAGKVCRFLATRHFGAVVVCTICGVDLQRDDGGRGYLVPAAGCPVWHGDKS